MASSRVVHFFATRADLEPGILVFEAQCDVWYVESKWYSSPGECAPLESLLRWPELGRACAPEREKSALFLVLPKGNTPVFRPIPQKSGPTVYAMDQLDNPHSMVISPGGTWRADALLAGQAGTTAKNSVSLRLLKGFQKSALRGFEKIQSFHVGPEAAGFLHRGLRLVTMGVSEPSEYDLRRP